MIHLKVLAAATGIPCDKNPQHLQLALTYAGRLTEELLAARGVSVEEFDAAIEAVGEAVDHAAKSAKPATENKRLPPVSDVIPQPSAEGAAVDDTEEVETTYTRTQIRAMKKKELVALCEVLGLKPSGTVAVLEKRLFKALEI